MDVVTGGSQMVITYSGTGGVTAANVLNFINIGGDFDQDAGDTIAAAWDILYEALGHEDYSAQGTYSWRDMSSDPWDEIFAVGTGATGDATGGCLPAQCAAVLSLSAGGGRRRHGRVYIPGIAESYVQDDSRLVSTFPIAALAAYVDFSTECITEAGWAPAVYSRTDSVVRPVTSAGMDSVLDTQRRRINRLA